ncbi:MAG: hypothetical protein NWE93_04050 [Candidatus Bathyarchaeota archaeon]|nr:hypothetical protein [Candidatus Bathyarchaeota archaeon]
MAALLSSKRKKSFIAIAVILLAFSILVIGGIVLSQLSNANSEPKPLEMEDSTSFQVILLINQTNALQDGYLPAQVTVITSEENENSSLIFESNLPDLECQFSPPIISSNGTSTLWIHVPESTPTGNYTLTITGQSNQRADNDSCVLSVVDTSVLNRAVTVHGFAIDARNPHAVLDSILFVDTETGQGEIRQAISGNYGAALLNQHIYNVTIKATRMDITPHQPLTYKTVLYVYAPEGENSMYSSWCIPD